METNNKIAMTPDYRKMNNQKALSKRLLKIKLTKLSDQYFTPQCNLHLKKATKIMKYRLFSIKNINDKIFQGAQFHFGNKNDQNQILNTDLSVSKYKNNYKNFNQLLKNEFSQNELETINCNKEYFVKYNKILKNYDLCENIDLHSQLNTEEPNNENNIKYIQKPCMSMNFIKKRKIFSKDIYLLSKAERERKFIEMEKIIREGILNIKIKQFEEEKFKEKNKIIGKIFQNQATKEVKEYLLRKKFQKKKKSSKIIIKNMNNFPKLPGLRPKKEIKHNLSESKSVETIETEFSNPNAKNIENNPLKRIKSSRIIISTPNIKKVNIRDGKEGSRKKRALELKNEKSVLKNITDKIKDIYIMKNDK